ncbi:MAG TPA: hypothetical protein VD735_03010 [Candidatus Saccharimonadales bacterium]|nr:hypothetical protein [Candidatus Saccharimonadales bacterium]
MSNTPNNAGKDVIYIDVDDEITAIIDKVRSSEQRIVALVLPKRATMMQSIVNMKLLKRTADNAKKHLVLITSEASLLPLAGTVGLYVAKTPQSRPEIPAMGAAHPGDDADDEPIALNAAGGVSEPALDPSKPIGAYTGAAAVGRGPAAGEDEAIEMPDEPDAQPKLNGSPINPDGPKPKKDRKLAIPDFNKFRLWLVLGGVGIVLLVFLGYLAFAVMPKATIAIKTDSSAIDADLSVELDPEETQVDIDNSTLPAFREEIKKTVTQTVEATGKKDNGTRAKGTITASTSCSADAPEPIPAGTGVTAQGLTFITQNTITFQPRVVNKKCQFEGSAPIISQQNGAQYNLDARNDYKIANNPSLAASGTATTGGTSVIVKVVQQSDIDSAAQKIGSQDNEAAKLDLEEALQQKSTMPVTETFGSTPGDVTPSVAAGTEAEGVTVTAQTTYFMLGVKEADLKKIIAEEVNKEIDTDKQTILDYGLDSAFFKVEATQNNTASVTLSTTAIAGSDLNTAEIKTQVAGMKANDAKEAIKEYPGVTEVSVKYSPFWVKSIPKKTGKITLTIEKPQVTNAKD